MTGPIDAEQLGRLLDEHGPALALSAAQWTDAADDCVQEALVELARQRQPPQHVVAWLYRVVKHRALNAARGDRRRGERESRARAERFSKNEQPVAIGGDEVVAAVDALMHLESAERELVIMRIWGNLTHKKMDGGRNVSTATSHRQYERALTTLRNILESPCGTNKNRVNTK